MAFLRTVLGDVELGSVDARDGDGIVLPHEHLFCDLRPLSEREAVADDPKAVEAAEGPLLAEAREYLDRMSGRAHQVMSGLVVVDGEGERSGLEKTTVVFKPLTDEEKERYVRFGEWRGRSGGYAIQTLGSTLVERLEGSVANVVGLPVGLLAALAPLLFERR